ncbi:MAG: dihydrodipicolinate synthase family protein [Acidobacteriota bacterium]
MTRTPARSIRGVNAAAVTARRPGDPGIDLAATFELIDFLSASGVQAIALLGTTGEFLHFDLRERTRLVELAVKRSRVPVVAAVGHSTLDGALLLGREAACAGASALVVMPPYFFRYQQDDIKEFYLRFAAGIKGAAPVFLYNIPFFTSEISPETAVELLATGLFAGIKDSSGCWETFLRLRAAREEKPFTLLVGNDVIFARARAAGADGVISGVAGALPELMVALDRAIVAGDAPQRERLDARLQEFISWVDRLPAPIGVREAAALRGLKVGPPAVPPGPEGQRLLAAFRDWFKEWLPEVQKECKDA